MFCIYCGSKLDDDSRFCTQCGKAVDPEPIKIPVPEPEPAETVYPTEPVEPVETVYYEDTAETVYSEDTEYTAETVKPAKPKKRFKAALLLIPLVIIAAAAWYFGIYVPESSAALTRSSSSSRSSSKSKSSGSSSADDYITSEGAVEIYVPSLDDLMSSEASDVSEADTPSYDSVTNSEADSVGSQSDVFATDIAVDDTQSDTFSTAATTLSDNVSSDSTLLPDIGLFLSCGRGEDKACGTNGHFVSYSFSLDEGSKIIDEVVELLQKGRYQLELVDYNEQDFIKSSALLCTGYFFNYTGTSGDIEVLDYSVFGSNYSTDVALRVNYYYDQGRIGMTLYYNENFTLEDPVSRVSAAPTDYNGTGVSDSSSSSGSSSSSSSSSSGVSVKCTKCHGEKTITCTNCDGKGYKEVYVSTPNYSGSSSTTSVSKETCYKCHGSGTITCTRCNGTGYA